METRGNLERSQRGLGLGVKGRVGSLLVLWRRNLFENDFAEFDPSRMVLRSVSLKCQVPRFKVLCEFFGVLIIDDFVAVEPDLDLSADGSNAHRIPLMSLTVLIFGISLIEPIIKVKTDGLLGDTPADVHLQPVGFLFWVVAQVYAAVVLPVLVDFEIQRKFKVLKLILRNKKSRALWVPLLTAG